MRVMTVALDHRISDGSSRTGGTGGPLLFARYAFGPNRYGLCGPDDWKALLEATSSGLEDDPGHHGIARSRTREIEGALRRMALDFEGALPYLQLIAGANGIADPLDARVVDAYWIGNRLSDRVSPALLARSMDERFRSRTRASEWRWLATKPAAGAKPTHAFHVLDVFTRVGLMRGGRVDSTVGLMDACRVRWGRVVATGDAGVLAEVASLEMREGKLAIGQPRIETVQRAIDDGDFTRHVRIGDVVSIHWGWLCEVLSPHRAAALVTRTQRQLAISNRTI